MAGVQVEMEERQVHYPVLIDFFSGVISGCSGIVVGQPFDTVKVRLQTHSTFYTGPIQCTKLTYQREGLRGFFKGMTSPLVGSACTNAIMFTVYERMLCLLDDTPNDPTLKSVLGAGLVSGFCQTISVSPTDLIKCRLQVQDGHESNRYRGPGECIKSIVKRNGVRGLFLGYPATLMREMPALGFYFSAYEWTKRTMLARNINPHTSMLVAGGLAGVGSWVIAYPADVIKSAVQTISDSAAPEERRIAFQARRLYRLGGMRVFFRGLETACARAFPVNAVTFYCYEIASERLKNLTAT